MKNSEIHNNLKNSEIRDFLGKSMISIQNEEVGYTKRTVSRFDCEDVFEHAIKIAEIEIERLQHFIEIRKNLRSIISLIKMSGWDEWDVSDYVDMDLSGYMSFIGTETEHTELMKKLKANLK